MSLGNDPEAVPDRGEPKPEDCRHCEGKTHDSRRICPDCRYEGMGQ